MAANLHFFHVAEIVDPVEARSCLVKAWFRELMIELLKTSSKGDPSQTRCTRTGKQALHAMRVRTDETRNFAPGKMCSSVR